MFKYYLFLLFFPISFSAQITVKGRVVDNNNNALEAASVYVFNKDTSRIIDFSITDKEGKWYAKVENKASKIIVVKFLGFKDSFNPLIDIDSNITVPDIILYPIDFKLKEVVVKAKKIDFIVNGDTISYKVNPLRDSTDFYIEDILEKIPEIEIKDNRLIYYKGKKVDNVLIEGKDLHDNRQRFFLKSFASKDIDKIEVIQHYKDLANKFNKTSSDKIALNVRLKNNAKNRIKYIMDASIGFDKKYAYGSNIYYIRNKMGINSYLKINNKGESDLSVMDFLRLQIPSSEEIENGTDVVPSGFMMPKDLNKNFDLVYAFNTEYKVKKSHSIKFSILSAYLNRENSSIIDRNYLFSDYILSGEKSGKSLFYTIDESLSTNFIFHKKLLLHFKFPVRYINNSGFDNLLDNFQDGLNTKFNTKYINLKSSPDFDLTYNLYDDLSLKFRYDAKYNDNQTLNFYKDSSAFNIININENVKSDFLNQKFIFHINHHSTSGLMIDIFQKFTSSQNNYKLKSSNKYILPDTNSILSDKIYSLNINIRTEFNNFKLFNKFELIENHKRTLNEYSNEFNYFNNNLYLGYNFSDLNYFGLSFFAKQSLYGFEDISNTQYLNDNRTIIQGSILPNIKKNIKGISFSYLNMENHKNFSTINTVSYTITKNPIIYNSSFKDGFFFLQKSIGLKNKSLSIFSNFNKSFKSWINKLYFIFKYSYSTIVYEKNKPSIINSILEINADLYFKISNNIKFKTGYEFMLSNQFIYNKNIIFTTHKPLFEITFKKDRLKLKNKFIYESNVYSQERILYPVWNFDFRYSFTSRFAIFMKGKDVLNINGRKFRGIKITPEYVEIHNYIKFPGYLMVGFVFAN